MMTPRQFGRLVDDVLAKAKKDIVAEMVKQGALAKEPDCPQCNDTGLWDYTNEHGVEFKQIVCSEPYCTAAERLSLMGCSLCERLVKDANTELCASCLVDPLEQVA